MSESDSLVHSENLPIGRAGELLHLPREKAKWEWMSFFVRRLAPDDVYRAETKGEEAAFVLLGGTCLADWGRARSELGNGTMCSMDILMRCICPQAMRLVLQPKRFAKLRNAACLRRRN